MTAFEERSEGVAMTGPSPDADWREALDTLERSLREAAQAITMLRRSLEGGAAPSHGATPPALREFPSRAEQEEQPGPAVHAAAAEGSSGESPAEQGSLAAFERVWARLEQERLARGQESAEEEPSAPRGLALLPRQYLITIEDRESKVDLVALHRALLGLSGIEDVSLVSFANGVPVISLRVTGDLDLDQQLSEAVSTAMDRQCEVIQHDSGKLFLRLTPRQDQGG
jgi:hypothetical protein